MTTLIPCISFLAARASSFQVNSRIISSPVHSRGCIRSCLPRASPTHLHCSKHTIAQSDSGQNAHRASGTGLRNPCIRPVPPLRRGETARTRASTCEPPRPASWRDDIRLSRRRAGAARANLVGHPGQRAVDYVLPFAGELERDVGVHFWCEQGRGRYITAGSHSRIWSGGTPVVLACMVSEEAVNEPVIHKEYRQQMCLCTQTMRYLRIRRVKLTATLPTIVREVCHPPGLVCFER